MEADPIARFLPCGPFRESWYPAACGKNTVQLILMYTVYIAKSQAFSGLRQSAWEGSRACIDGGPGLGRTDPFARNCLRPAIISGLMFILSPDGKVCSR